MLGHLRQCHCTDTRRTLLLCDSEFLQISALHQQLVTAPAGAAIACCSAHHAHPAATACSEAPRVPEQQQHIPEQVTIEHAPAQSCTGSTTTAAASKPLR
jgi:hypothetical protein